MKKMFFSLTIVLCLMILSGCNKKIDINTQFSEITYTFYNGVSNDGKISASISVGQREEPYIIDGKHGENVDFSLIVVRFDFFIEENEIEIDFYKGNEKSVIALEFNPLNSTFMTDLGYSLEDDEEYSIMYGNIMLEFYKISKDFKVDYQSAIEKSLIKLGDEVLSYYNGNVFQAECYLKILSKTDGDFQELYWVFQIFGQNGLNSSVVIDIKEGSIILSS